VPPRHLGPLSIPFLCEKSTNEHSTPVTCE
jgi:hypothetical protein